MWAKFKSFPLSVRLAIVFLLAAVSWGVVAIPSFVIPLLTVLGVLGSILRIAVYLVHGV